MKIRFALYTALFCAAAVLSPVFAQTAIHPADWSATANMVTIQTSGKALMFHVSDVSQAVRLTILDLKGRTIWSRTVMPVDGAVTIAWNGTVGATGTESVLPGVYVARTEMVGAGRKSLGSRQFVYAP
jgi:hypothetical protein